ncbi:MAG: hypothetical protein FWE85_02925 [Clostridiales bacterium]|nr:hypothetical protein [Clostridiales bacterium]
MIYGKDEKGFCPYRDSQIQSLTVGVAGGDERELILMRGLLQAGLAVRCFAQPAELLPEGVTVCETLRQAVCGADALVLPMPGVKNDGGIYSAYGFKPVLKEKDLSPLAKGAPVLVGIASSYLQGLAEKLGLRLVAMADRDEIAVPNAIPTAY